MKQTDIQQFVEDLDGGQFSADLGKILTAVGVAVCDHSAGGEVTIKLKMKQIGIKHDISYERPTARGKVSEKTGGETAMYVSATQGMTFFPSREGQGSLIGKNGEARTGGEMPPTQ